VILVLIIAGGDGTSDSNVSQVSIVDPSDLPAELVTTSDLDAHPTDSPQRAFLEWWRDLQFHAWPAAAAGLDPGLRSLVGYGTLIDAFKPNTAWYPTVKPKILNSAEAGRCIPAPQPGPCSVSIDYAVGSPFAEGVISSNAVLISAGGSWRVLYDSNLDLAISAGVQERIRIQTDPTKAIPPASAQRNAAQLSARIDEYVGQRIGNG
jgi:hypothetical protein